MKEVFDDIPRHRKKRVKKSPPKSDHKHEYASCVYEIRTVKLDKAHGFIPNTRFAIGTYCPICGRIGSTHNNEYWVEGEKLDTGAMRAGHWSEAAEKEFSPETRSLPFFLVEDVFKQKFVE